VECALAFRDTTSRGWRRRMPEKIARLDGDLAVSDRLGPMLVPILRFLRQYMRSKITVYVGVLTKMAFNGKLMIS